MVEVARRQQKLEPIRERFSVARLYRRVKQIGAHFAILTLAISLRVTPASFFGPTTITVHVRAPLVQTDRKLVVLLDSENYGTSDERTVDPEHPQPFYVFTFTRVPEGQYTVTAQIGDWSHVRASDRVQIEIR